MKQMRTISSTEIPESLSGWLWPLTDMLLSLHGMNLDEGHGGSIACMPW